MTLRCNRPFKTSFMLLLGASLFFVMYEWRNGGPKRGSNSIASAVKSHNLTDSDLTNPGFSAQTSPLDSANKAKLGLSRLTSRLPLSFEANLGQTDEKVKFLSR